MFLICISVNFLLVMIEKTKPLLFKDVEKQVFIGNYEGVYNFIITGLTPTGIMLAEDGNAYTNEFG